MGASILGGDRFNIANGSGLVLSAFSVRDLERLGAPSYQRLEKPGGKRWARCVAKSS